MKIQPDKCEFLKKEVEFLGFVVSENGVKTSPKKVEAVKNLPVPKTIRELRSFLGLAGYYRRFIKGYAQIAKPLTVMLRGEAGRLSKTASNKAAIKLNNEAMLAIKKIKNSLTSEDLMLAYPDYSKTFQLTTDASDYAIGAVLSQEDRPIMFISRTLNVTEERYATNEKEMLAIIWALNTFRNYLYGTAMVKIYTDHQPLTFALSNKNTNAKMKRWKAILEEYNHELIYRPGKANVVADALSRPPKTSEINNTSSLSIAQHSDSSSGENLIQTALEPINVYKNQIFLQYGDIPSYQFEIIFPTYHRHKIKEPQYSVELLKRYLNPSVTNGINTSEEIMGIIQRIFPSNFANYRVRFARRIVRDITNENEQQEVSIEEHNRAHRNSQENKIQLLGKVYFPQMRAKISKIVKQCRICREQKYDRHPAKPVLQETPIPQFPGHIVHIDLYFTNKRTLLTAIDKFSKYAQVKILKSRAVEDIKGPLREIITSFGTPTTVVFDNEKSFNSNAIIFMLENQFGIEVYNAPPYSKTSNGQIERFHSTYSEILRCIQANRTHDSIEDLVDKATYHYNHSVHSTIGKKSVEVFFGHSVTTNPEQLGNEKKIS